MPEQHNPDALHSQEYGDASNLKTRIRIQAAHRSNPQNWFHWLFDRMEIPPQSRILELGCGPGDLWLENLERLQPGWKIFLTDFSMEMVREVRRTALGSDARFIFGCIDAQTIPFPDEYFVAILGNGLLDQIPARRQALREIKRVLKTGGRFYTSTGGRTHLQELENMVRPFLPEADYGGDPDRFGLENGRAILSSLFTEIHRERYPDELVFDRPEPLLAFALSESRVKSQMKGERLDHFRRFVEGKFASESVVRISSDKGLFTAMKA